MSSRSLAFCLGVTFVTGCSLLTSLDGLSGNAGDGDGAVLLEASSDGGIVIDDGGDAPKVDASTFSCATITPKPVFCDDFERDSLMGSWTDTTLDMGGTISIDSKDSISPSRSFFAMTAASAKDDLFSSVLRHDTFSGMANKVTLSLDAKISQLDQGQVDIFRIYLHMPGDPQSGSLALCMTMLPDGAYVSENDYRQTPTVYHSHHFAMSPTFGSWQHYELDIDLGGSPKIVALLDGQIQSTGSFSSDKLKPAGVEILVGAYHSGLPGNARNVHIDNVVLQTQ